ncbi:MAG TPA: DnaB-like helicase C-terminal domain-containing protein [Candidatus Binatia bacterium]|nr:DnaB-like helicase C-terminal domain-containing protein [Candidatus Binatia bacterium]
MDKKQAPKSEAEELGSFLEELQKEHQVRDIAGWETGFSGLSGLLNGILPGLYFVTGLPACGKTAFAKQLLDQVILHNSVAGIFFSFAEKKKDLRIRTLARLSGLENREIRRGSAFLLHWYGVPKGSVTHVDRLSPSWEKLKRSAEDARSWWARTYLVECGRETKPQEIAEQILAVKELQNARPVLIVIDDCQRLAGNDQPLQDRLAMIADQLQGIAIALEVPILAVWPVFRKEGAGFDRLPQFWAETVPADVVLVLESDPERTKQLTEPNQAILLHVVKNRGGEKGKLAFDFLPAFSKFVEVPKP